MAIYLYEGKNSKSDQEIKYKLQTTVLMLLAMPRIFFFLLRKLFYFIYLTENGYSQVIIVCEKWGVELYGKLTMKIIHSFNYITV